MILLGSGCAPKPIVPTVPKTEFVVLVPNKLPVPTPPTFKKFDKSQPMHSEYNFRVYQENVVLLVNHSNTKSDILDAYELAIDKLMEEKLKLETENNP